MSPIHKTQQHPTKIKHTTKNRDTQNTTNTRPIPECWKCGNKFISGHLISCPAKNEISKICKKSATIQKSAKWKCPHRDQKQEHTHTKQKHHKHKSNQQLSTKHWGSKEHKALNHRERITSRERVFRIERIP